MRKVKKPLQNLRNVCPESPIYVASIQQIASCEPFVSHCKNLFLVDFWCFVSMCSSIAQAELEAFSSCSASTKQLVNNCQSTMSFEYIVKAWLMPSVSLFGIAGNFLSIYILHHREVKLKKDFVDVLCMLATFDNLLLLTTFFLFSMPAISTAWTDQVGYDY